MFGRELYNNNLNRFAAHVRNLPILYYLQNKVLYKKVIKIRRVKINFITKYFACKTRQS